MTKLNENPYGDLYWNVPETKFGAVNVVGGNGQSFRTVVKTAEFLAMHYPVKNVGVVLPDAFRGKLPELPGLTFLKSTESGSFADSDELVRAFNGADFNLLVGDLSKNAETVKAVGQAVLAAEKPVLATRDAVDLLVEYQPERVLMQENLMWFASLTQLQKLFRAVYYPKVLLLSQSLVQVAESLHKFTLSYPSKIVTLHNGQILVAMNGRVVVVPLEKSGFSPLTLWGGEMAAKMVAMNLYNPEKFVEATVAAIFAE